MRIMTYAVIAGAIMASTVAASAADLPYPQPVPAPVDFGGWYLRGDIGFSNQSVKNIRNGNTALYPAGQVLNEQTSFNSAGVFGLGVGYQFNNWFRGDITGQYRGKSNFTGVDTFVNPGPAAGIDTYNASKSEWLFLANAYVDMGTWWGITPFIGAGVGTAQVTLSNFTDVGVFDGNPASFASAPSHSKWNFAWAAHAGLAYKVSPSLTMELAYSYIDMGSGTTGIVSTYTGTTTNNVMRFNHITSQDLTLGLRWAIDPMPSYYSPPLITKG
jgi:opacity protein-like surface antigen